MITEPFYPIGIQDFESMRELNAVYVDKTELIYRLTHTSKYVFLSRPRRFGKSLLCSTLRHYFEGHKQLFEGLSIDKYEKEWNTFPVIHISLASAKNCTPAQLTRKLYEVLEPYEDIYGKSGMEMPGSKLADIIRRAYKQTNKKAVIIIDEYDAPLLDVLHEDEPLREVRRTMQEFYSGLKDTDPYLRFCFITGITKFSQLSIFSTLNNLENISMQDVYSALCGISEKELHMYFHDGITELSHTLKISEEDVMNMLKSKYDGYHFSKGSEDIYNPFSLLNAFKQKSLEDFWFSAGTPSYLIHMMKRFNTDITGLDSFTAHAEDFNIPTEAMENATAILYQSGYLTIKDYDATMDRYTLGIPNNEVRIGLINNLVPTIIFHAKQGQSKIGL
jgi:hypothetical protein